jgi:hypothetical protein
MAEQILADPTRAKRAPTEPARKPAMSPVQAFVPAKLAQDIRQRCQSYGIPMREVVIWGLREWLSATK